MSEYFLPPHVHFCRRGDDFVFLDLQQDDYVLINGAAAAALRDIAAERGNATEHAAALRELLEGGLLVTRRAAGKSLRATMAELALESLLDSEIEQQPRVRLTHVYGFIAACTKAAVRLRWSTLQRTVNAVELRKARNAVRGFEVGKARELTAVFLKLRSFFPLDYLCLYDSLALVEFLARYGVFPTWVFGVKLEPWSAHCWVQEGQFVFNEGVEEAAGYTPIMTI